MGWTGHKQTRFMSTCPSSSPLPPSTAAPLHLISAKCQDNPPFPLIHTQQNMCINLPLSLTLTHTNTVEIPTESPLAWEMCLGKTRSRRSWSLTHTHTQALRERQKEWADWSGFHYRGEKKRKALHPIWGPHSSTCSSVTTGYMWKGGWGGDRVNRKKRRE